jgi:hypothetical protein
MRRCTPPARAGQGTAPQDRFVFIAHNALAPTRLVLAGSKCESAIREVCGGGSPSAGGTGGAYFLFFKTPRTLLTTEVDGHCSKDSGSYVSPASLV